METLPGPPIHTLEQGLRNVQTMLSNLFDTYLEKMKPPDAEELDAVNPIEKKALALKAACNSLESDHTTLLGYRDAGKKAVLFQKQLSEVIDGKIMEINKRKEQHHEDCAAKAKELPGARQTTALSSAHTQPSHEPSLHARASPPTGEICDFAKQMKALHANQCLREHAKILEYVTDEAADAIDVCNKRKLVFLKPSEEPVMKSLGSLAMKAEDKEKSLSKLDEAIKLLPK